jgi:hypothetical protein
MWSVGQGSLQVLFFFSLIFSKSEKTLEKPLEESKSALI